MQGGDEIRCVHTRGLATHEGGLDAGCPPLVDGLGLGLLASGEGEGVDAESSLQP
jgi:hypothetical protein